MADDFMQENVTEKMVVISLQVRLYETLCKSNMMSDNFEVSPAAVGSVGPVGLLNLD